MIDTLGHLSLVIPKVPWQSLGSLNDVKCGMDPKIFQRPRINSWPMLMHCCLVLKRCWLDCGFNVKPKSWFFPYLTWPQLMVCDKLDVFFFFSAPSILHFLRFWDTDTTPNNMKKTTERNVCAIFLWSFSSMFCEKTIGDEVSNLFSTFKNPELLQQMSLFHTTSDVDGYGKNGAWLRLEHIVSLLSRQAAMCNQLWIPLYSPRCLHIYEYTMIYMKYTHIWRNPFQ